MSDAELFYLTQSTEQTYNTGVDLTPTSYTKVGDFSDEDRTVYTKDNKAYIVFRATNPFNPDDIKADFDIYNGTQSDSIRFRKSEDTTQRVMKKYGKDNVILAGYSLGGSQAMYLSDRLSLPATVFNPGISPITIDKEKHKNYSKVNLYFNPGDPISTSAVDIWNGSGVNITPVFDKKALKHIGQHVGEGAVYTSTGVPVTKGQAAADLAVRAAEITQPELIPIIESVKKIYGAASLFIDSAITLHSLDNFNDYFAVEKPGKNLPHKNNTPDIMSIITAAAGHAHSDIRANSGLQTNVFGGKKTPKTSAVATPAPKTTPTPAPTLNHRLPIPEGTSNEDFHFGHQDPFPQIIHPAPQVPALVHTADPTPTPVPTLTHRLPIPIPEGTSNEDFHFGHQDSENGITQKPHNSDITKTPSAPEPIHHNSDIQIPVNPTTTFNSASAVPNFLIPRYGVPAYPEPQRLKPHKVKKVHHHKKKHK